MNNNDLIKDALQLCLDARLDKNSNLGSELISLEKAEGILQYNESLTPDFLLQEKVIIEIIKSTATLLDNKNTLRGLRSVRFDYERLDRWIEEQQELNGFSSSSKKYGIFELDEDGNLLINNIDLEFEQGRGLHSILSELIINPEHALNNSQIHKIIHRDVKFTGHKSQNSSVNDTIENIRRRFVVKTGKSEARKLIQWLDKKYTLFES